MHIPYLYRKFKYLKSFLYLNRSFRYFKKHSVSFEFPRSLKIQTQSLCNGQCAICPHPALRDKQEQGIMTQELFEKIAHQAAKEPLLSKACFMLQNEPLLDKRIFQWVRYFKSLNQKKIAEIVTNGELIDGFTSKEIIQSRLDILAISLNAHTEHTFNIINKGINYKKVIENINFLLSHPVMKSKIVISFVYTKINKEEIYEAIRFWGRKGVRTQVKYISNRAGTLENYHYYKPERIRPGIFVNMERRLLRYYRKNTLGCFLPFSSMCILFNGDVILCCNDWRRTSILGNVNQHLLRSIWNSNEINKIRRLLSEGEYADIIPCRQCTKTAGYPRRNAALGETKEGIDRHK